MKLTQKEAEAILLRFYGTDGFCSTYLEHCATQTLGYERAMHIIRTIVKQKLGIKPVSC